VTGVQTCALPIYLLTGSSFHTRTIIRRCECEGEITLRGEALSVLHDYLENR